MDHLSAMTARLPVIYREGELLITTLGHLANQVAFLDEDMATIRREHWFGRAVDLADAAALGDLLDLAPEPWMDVDIYRAWVDAIVHTTVTAGAVTVAAIEEIVFQYLSRYQAATGDVVVAAFDLVPDGPGRPAWVNPAAGEPAPGGSAAGDSPALVENPPRRKYGPGPEAARPQPLQQITLRQHGLDPAALGLLLTGLAGEPEACPILAHLGASEALVYLGSIATGERLWIRPDGAGVTAMLEGRDVTSDLRTVTGFTPGVPWSTGEVMPARPLVLTPGDNTLWFLPAAVYDEPGLGRFLLSLADLTVTEGRFDSSSFGAALFSQEPRIRLDATWVETAPAAFSVRLPAGTLSTPASSDGQDGTTAVTQAIDSRQRLASSLTEAVGRLRAAGVTADVQLLPFTETVCQYDALTATLPLVHREGGPSGADRLPDSGGTFGVTRFGKSTFR
jgi:hypothetical protein